ncbi:hypothetical protein PFBG_06193, partial [Plasmodium falciparum 7G8]
MAPDRGGHGGGDIEHDKDAKHMFDRIGAEVQTIAHSAALGRSHSKLKGDLSSVKFYTKKRIENSNVTNPCQLDHEYDTNVTGGFDTNNPCANRSNIRFSDKYGGQCTDTKIKGNDPANGGACAPFRRLFLCDQNLAYMPEHKINNTHDLLLEVCLAAKYEGQSITRDYPKYRATYGDSPSEMCTMLARSFADIGDIIRGKDLYLGNPQESTQRKKLESKLKEIFAKIHEELKNGKTNKEAAKDHYKDDKDENYYKLREDWWTANRATIWEALTCEAGTIDKYFRKTACAGTRKTDDKCRCDGDQVPTYFDYVPQYLRWFEEWAEDFCRKKNKKIKDVKRNCREKDKSGEERYCSRNGYDCEQTVNARGKLRYGKQCISCLYACNPYVEWINNQKEQFDKQVKKYQTEIQTYTNGTVGSGRTKRAATIKYEGYEKKFYDILKNDGYGNVNKFLEKLNEGVCKKITTQEEGRISFENVNSRGGDGVAASGGTSDTSGTNDINNGTFYRSKYCQPCPDCGVKKKDGDSGNEWEEKQRDEKCKRGNIYKPGSGATPTDVTILKSGEGHDDIAEKLKAFCDKKDGGGGSGDCGGNSDSSLCEKWKCYKGEDVMKAEDDDDEQDYLNMKNAGGLCILKKENKSSKEPADIQKTYNDFFYYWVVHMLKDSIYWRTEKLDKCINNTNGKQTKCKKGCNNDCECFLKWVNRKRTEWGKIKEQFSKQEGIPEGYYFITLEGVLELEFANENSTKDAENNVSAEEAKEIKHLRDIIKKKKEEEEAAGGSGIGAAPDGKKKTIMDKLIDYEKDEADLCLEIHEDEEEGGGNDECDDDHEETQIVKSNPCATPSGSRHRALANEAAQLMHKAAKTQLASRVGRSKLRAHAHLGTYKRGGSPSGFKKDKICSIDARHSNRNPEHSEEPCHGKGTGTDTGTRFEIGTVWEKDKTNMRVGHEEFIIPPRRRHMCTSNLEYLETGDVPFIGNNATLINDSFLGDVLLSAKYEAENIKKLYEKNKDQSGHEVICRAVRYSFADLGDIIRGRDLWEHGDQTKLQGHLKTIFGNIHKSLEGIQGNHKYKNDEYNTPPYKKLREDWWEANRHQVWKAMKCATKEINNNKCNGIPIDDYIPQRLRWMVEWAEWYCKYQSQEYENLVASCKGCMGNGQGCTKESGEICTKCDKQCKEYGKKIRTWKDQWTKIKEKYEELYLQAKITSTNAGSTVFPDAGPDYQQVVDFFKELQKEINRSASQRSKRSIDDTTTDPTLTSPYSTAEGYIHQELPHMECQVQKEFCKHKNGGTTPTGTENKEYVFKDKPHDHDTPCNCDKPPIKDACDIVDGILKEDHGDSKVGECNPKNKDNNYPAWQCDKSSNLVKENGICMPPRRQKLCLYYIAHHSQKIYLNTQKGLREAFIRTAAAETFVSWNYYKTKNGADAKQLDNGTIPEEFLRSMIYTFGDFRDICLDTDISKKLPRSDVSNAKDNIDAYFKKNPDPNRTKWWDENGPEIWKGMLCALEKASGKKEELTGPDSKYQYNKVTFSGDKSPTLEKFAQTPQFLR